MLSAVPDTYNKPFLFIAFILILAGISMAAFYISGLNDSLIAGETNKVQNANQEEIVNFSVNTESFREDTLIPMHQFKESRDLDIHFYGGGHIYLIYEDRKMMVREGDDSAQLNREETNLAAPPERINDDVLLPLQSVEKLFQVSAAEENGDLVLIDDYAEDTFVNDEGDEEKVGLVMRIKPELEKVAAGESFSVKIMLQNYTESAQNFTFNTGQKFELELVDEEGETVYIWSRGQVFTQAVEQIELEAGEEKSWSTYINTAGLQPDEYNLQGWLTDRENSAEAEPVKIVIE